MKIVWWIIGLAIGWYIFFGSSNNTSNRKYIRESFKNGRTIEVPIDESITRDTWECTGDCSGHNAGYEWAADKGITDPDDCGGRSQSFVEGCEAYANEN
jgi:hypothetical protein